MNDRINELREILGDCKRPDSSNCQNKTSYEITNQIAFCIVDDGDIYPVRIVDDSDYFQLKVQNPNQYEICLIKTDKCLFNGNEHKKCDCILFNESKYYFVEISEANKRCRSEKRKDAVEQLATTIKIFEESEIDLSNYSSKAIICFKSVKPYITKASLNSKKAEFYDAYGIDLEEGNLISF